MKPNSLHSQAGRSQRSAWARLLVLAVLLLIAVKLPATQTSAVVATGGGSASSAAYSLLDTVGQPCIGSASSASYTLGDGFLFDIDSPPIEGTSPSLPVTNNAGAISLAALLTAVSDPDGDPLALFNLDTTTALGGTVTLIGNWVVYQPPSGFIGGDSFHYTVADSDGNLLTCQVNVLKVNPGPVFEPVADQIAYVLMPLVITNYAADPDLPLTFALANDAPSGASVNPTNGVFCWMPARDQARSTNVISVVVTDGGAPAASATNTFTVVVDDYVEIGFGRMAVGTGRTNSLPISLATSASLTNVQVVFQAPENKAVALALSDWAAEVGDATLLHLAPDTWQIEFTAGTGQVLPSTSELARISFRATAIPSAFAPLTYVGLTNLDTAGASVWRILAHDGQVAVVATEPLMEALARTNDRPNLVLYGNPGVDYEVQMTSELPATSWQSVWQGTMSSEYGLAITSITNVSPAMFFRARSIAGP